MDSPPSEIVVLSVLRVKAGEEVVGGVTGSYFFLQDVTVITATSRMSGIKSFVFIVLIFRVDNKICF